MNTKIIFKKLCLGVYKTFGFLSVLCFAANVQSQTVNELPVSKDAVQPPVTSGNGGFSDFFNKVKKSVQSVGESAKNSGDYSVAVVNGQLIYTLKPGRYVKSSEAIGEQRDLDESRVTRGLIFLPTFEQYANGILTRLKTVSGVTEIPGRLLIAANEQLDAGATADGHIFISSGYIRELKNEDQLAALLAHELSHIILRHHDSNVIGKTQRQVAAWTNVGMSLFNSVSSIANGSNSASPLTSKQGDALKKMETLIAINDIALGPAWGRKLESEADRLGMDLLIKAGYSYQHGMIGWLEIVAKWDAMQTAKKLESDKKQQQSMEALASKGQVDALVKNGVDFAVSGVIAKMSASHDHGDTRLDDLDDYFVKVYNESVPDVAASITNFNIQKNNDIVRATLDDYSRTFEARSLIGNKDFFAAANLLSSVLTQKSLIESHSLPNQLMFEALFNMGRGVEAESYLFKSLNSDNQVWSVYDSAASYFRGRGNINAVIQTGQSAFNRFSGAPSAYPKLVALYKNAGLTANMNAALSECVLKQSDRRDQCIAASK